MFECSSCFIFKNQTFPYQEQVCRSGARPGRESLTCIAHLGLGAHGGANGLVPLLPASLCESNKAIRIALGEQQGGKCALRKILSEGFWIVSSDSSDLPKLQNFGTIQVN